MFFRVECSLEVKVGLLARKFIRGTESMSFGNILQGNLSESANRDGSTIELESEDLYKST